MTPGEKFLDADASERDSETGFFCRMTSSGGECHCVTSCT